MKLLAVLVVISVPFVFGAEGHSQTRHEESQVGLSSILSLGGMRKELEMSDEQANNLMDLWITTSDELKSKLDQFARQAGGLISEEKRNELEEELKQAIKKVRDKELETINAVLLPHQVKRLKELHVQYAKRNSGGFQTIADQLDMDAAQKEEVVQVGISLKTKTRELYGKVRDGELSQAEFKIQLQTLQKETEDELLSILTPTQRKKLKELEGEKFEFQTSANRESKEESATESKSEKDRDDG